MAHNTHWLDRERLSNYPKIFVLVYLIVSIAWVLLSQNMVDQKGKPLGYDFITFWAASYLGLAGHGQDAYNMSFLFKAEQIAVPASQMLFLWYYPPSFFLVILPLALLPYVAAYWTFMFATLSCYVVVFRRIVHNSTAMWCLAAFSGLWMNLFHGQNAFLTAALAGAALLCLEQRPILAGVFIGLLVIKPHLAVLFPIALVACGAWRTFATAGITAFAFLSIGTAALGTSTLKASLASFDSARLNLESGVLPWHKMPSVFAFLRLLGIPVTAAYFVHFVVAVIGVIAVWHVWRCCRDSQLRCAALMTATLLVSPYVFDYDLAWLAFPIAWLALTGLQNGWLYGDREVLFAAWILALFMGPIAGAVSLQIGPFVLGALLWITMRRAQACLRSDTAVITC